MMSRKTFLTCAVTGNLTTRAQHPSLPISPREIATAALEAEKAGAAIVHLHARDPITQRGSMEVELFREIVDRIRQAGSRVIVNLSTGEGGRFVPGRDDPATAGVGTTLTRPELRVAHVVALKPDICTLDLNTMYSGTAVVINTPENISRMAEQVYASGVLPELELFDGGDLQLAHALLSSGVLRRPLLVQLVLGVRYGAMANPATLHYMASQLPADCIWSAFGIGRHEFPILAQAFLMGGHIRVGLEDNIYIRKGELARDNAQLVEKAAMLIDGLGGTLATVDEAREMVHLPWRETVSSV